MNEILAEPAGSVLDQLVAEHVMQWTNERDEDDIRATRYTMEPHGPGTTRGLGVWHHGTWGWFAPSRSIADAWRAVEQGRWYDNVALIRYGAGYACIVLAGRHGGSVIAEGETAPLALCRAALVLVWESSGQ